MADEKQLLSLRSLSFLPTKKEQYATLRKLQMLSIADKHTYCQRALKTTPAVNRTTNSFYQDLNSLTSGSLTSKPVLLDPMQLHVLKHCSKTFSQIIQNCPNHRIPLTQIKKCYDSHLDSALREFERDGGHKEVWPGTRSHDVSCDHEVVRCVQSLEEKIRNLQAENQHLMEVLEKERRKMETELSMIDGQDTPDNRSHSMEGIMDSIDHMTLLQQQLFDLHTQTKKSVGLRSGKVSLSMCQSLEQCIRYSELNIQKLRKQNSTLLQNVQELETKLQQYFGTFNTSTSDIE